MSLVSAFIDFIGFFLVMLQAFFLYTRNKVSRAKCCGNIFFVLAFHTRFSWAKRKQCLRNIARIPICKCTFSSLQAKALGRVLFDQVCKQLHLLEADYFGLEYQEPNGTKVRNLFFLYTRIWLLKWRFFRQWTDFSGFLKIPRCIRGNLN